MAETKKTVAKAADSKKVEDVAEVKETSKTEAKKAPAKKTAEKPAAKKTTTKKTTTASKAAAVKEPEAEVFLQFSGKAYSDADLVKIAKDVWQYDLNRELKDFKKVSIYVKPEEHLAYYVINDEVSGNFAL